MNVNLRYYEEPYVEIGNKQFATDPRRGLTLFGPYSTHSPSEIRYGLIGTESCLNIASRWLDSIDNLHRTSGSLRARPLFPGFSTAFNCIFPKTPTKTICIDENILSHNLKFRDLHQRVYNTVSLFVDPLIRYHDEEDARIDVWLVVIPDTIKSLCRPEASYPEEAINSTIPMSKKKAAQLSHSPSLFEEENEFAELYNYHSDFHNQLKARLLYKKITTQIIIDRTILSAEMRDDRDRRTYEKLVSNIYWTISSALYYKSGGLPWRLGRVRPGVCYLGYIFKRFPFANRDTYSCSAAQLILDDGDGTVFKGANGSWYSKETREFHLDATSAAGLIKQAVDQYSYITGRSPSMMVVHGRTELNDSEWNGMLSAAGSDTELVYIRIKKDDFLKFYTGRKYPAPRGLVLIRDSREAVLMSSGYIPELGTVIGLGMPRPLSVRIIRGKGDIDMIAQDVLALTKLNYNSCGHSDSLPITLKYADRIGSVLVAMKSTTTPPLQFRYYI